MALVEPGTLIVIVDDDVDAGHSVADVLTLEGYDVRAHSSADAAWNEIARGEEPAAIILDLWLRGMSSGEFIRRLRASRASTVPVLVLSGSREAEQTEFDVEAVCRKPIEATALVRAVDKLVRLRSRRGKPPRKEPRGTSAGASVGRRRGGAKPKN